MIIVYCALALFATVQAYLTTHLDDGRNLTNYNNYLIFRQSFVHLMNYQDIYLKFKYEYWDVFKYTPTFALFMFPFAVFPVIPGLLLWNLVNVASVIIGLNNISLLTSKQKSLILLFSLVEIATSIQNEQSNALVTGLIICAFALMEKRKLFFAVGLIVFVVYVKLLGAAVLIMFAFYPRFWRAVAYAFCWSIIFLLFPLLVIRPDQLVFLYGRWIEILNDDLAGTGGLSVMTVMRSWLSLDFQSVYIQIAGMIALCTPLLFWKRFSDVQSRLLFLSSILVWIVIFNHKAESPSFVIAVIGVIIWYVISVKSGVNTALLVLCFVFTQLSATDLFPRNLRNGFFEEYAVKALPCVLIWIKMNIDIVNHLRGRQIFPLLNHQQSS